MSELTEPLTAAFARRLAERDNPPPPPPLDPAPDAVQARIEAWLRRTYHQRDGRSALRMGRMLLALVQHPTRTTADLATAAGLPTRSAARVAIHLHELGLTTWTERSIWRDHRLTPATEDALLLVVVGPGAAIPPLSAGNGAT